MNTTRINLAGAGTQTAGLAFGGFIPPATFSGATELWNGTSWTSASNSMATARRYPGGAGTQAAGLAFSGTTPSPTAATEEWTSAAATRTITTS
jgi:hypothetical protein